MKYALMSLNGLEGFQKGHFKTLDMLYYVGHDTDKDISEAHGIDIQWADLIAEARHFETEAEVWETANSIWGDGWFSKANFAVMSFNDEALRRD